jgi:hypothetical protein
MKSFLSFMLFTRFFCVFLKIKISRGLYKASCVFVFAIYSVVLQYAMFEIYAIRNI